MQSRILMGSIVVASMLALGLCDTIKSKIPFIGGADEEAPVQEAVAEGGEAEAPDEEPAPAEAAEEASPADEGAKQEAVAEAEPAPEEPPAEEEPARPAKPPSFDEDVPKHIRTAAKITTVLVLAHPEDRKKYTAYAKKLTPDIKKCHKQILADKPNAQGKIKFRITVSADGVATDVAIEKNSTGSDELAECGAQVFKAHEWPRRKDGQERVLAIPIMFEVPEKGPELLI